MPDIVTTWTIVHRRRLADGEDPFAPGAGDQEHLLWALEEGAVSATVELVETS